MKKIFTFIIALTLSFNIFAESRLTEAVDFTAIDCHGTEVHLFDILDGGQYVLIDFFFSTCGPCNQVCPFVVEAYEALGCNNYDVFFMEISPSDNNASCQNWCNTYGVEYPTIGTQGGGNAICDTYEIEFYPTLILIAPDRRIVIQDLWPIYNAQSIINALTSYGIEQHDCKTYEDPTVGITIGEVTSTTVQATFTPNETCDSYYILIGIKAEMQQWVNMMQMSLEQLIKMWGIQKTGESTYTWTGQIPNTEYTIYALPLDADDNMYELSTILVTTAVSGGTGVSVIALEVEILNDTTVKTIATPNEETTIYHYGLITVDYYNKIGADSAVSIIRNNNYPLYETNEWIWSGLIPNTYYYALSTGQNINGEWGEATLLEFMTSLTGIAKLNEGKFNIYPNPASSVIYLDSDISDGVKISIVDMAGHLIKQIQLSDIQNTSIDVGDLESGIYFFIITQNDEMSIRKIMIK